ncbi:hypothetical protein OSJ77_07085 [Phyllobacterium sp. 0TCS1.6C]|uniref:hypothetical protein n=1 Tax=unclassified Phyllobacterium TaxID=2638441 RepID=UPI0022644C86|nr:MULTISPECIES: hypothetical protein [unclassified Phyllobacterium]MCX8279946.1 hypothetical protein [Phyllobacterium sp. 0TCS1.6C]MCX8296113.1 hypothetical protein [Phyllobacterium sp. 0TCS1.6A]
MGKFYIVDDMTTDKLWLVDEHKRSIELIDRDVLGSMGNAGAEFLKRMDNRDRSTVMSGVCRSDASDRAYSASPC